MSGAPLVPSVNYLIVGHVTADRAGGGRHLGGTAAYAGLTAAVFGHRVGVVTSAANDLDLTPLTGLAVHHIASDQSTEFENHDSAGGRRQRIFSVARRLGSDDVPPVWRSTPLVHLAPVAAEVEAGMVAAFPHSMVAITAQGWLRKWGPDGAVVPSPWEEHRDDLGQASAVIASLEDLGGAERSVEDLAAHCRLLVLTEGERGVRVYWNGDVRRFAAPPASPVDPTGAGDIFAAAFVCRYFATRDPWESARLATRLATASLGRAGLSGVPTPEEAQAALIEVLA